MSIPNTIHIIWFGGLLPDKYLANLMLWRIHNPEMRIIFWTADRDQNPDDAKLMTTICANYNIEFKDIFKSDIPNQDNIAFEYSLKNWARASDIARLSILYKFGGYYFDTDLKPHSPLLKMHGERSDVLQFIETKDDIKRLNIYFMASAPNHELYKSALSLIQLRYRLLSTTKFATFCTTKDFDLLVLVTTFLSGNALQTMFEAAGYDKDKVNYPLKEVVHIRCDKTWLADATKEVDQSAREAFLKYTKLLEHLEKSQAFKRLTQEAQPPKSPSHIGLFSRAKVSEKKGAGVEDEQQAKP